MKFLRIISKVWTSVSVALWITAVSRRWSVLARYRRGLDRGSATVKCRSNNKQHVKRLDFNPLSDTTLILHNAYCSCYINAFFYQVKSANDCISFTGIIYKIISLLTPDTLNDETHNICSYFFLIEPQIRTKIQTYVL